jgi:hypothetical protein
MRGMTPNIQIYPMSTTNWSAVPVSKPNCQPLDDIAISSTAGAGWAGLDQHGLTSIRSMISCGCLAWHIKVPPMSFVTYVTKVRRKNARHVVTKRVCVGTCISATINRHRPIHDWGRVDHIQYLLPYIVMGARGSHSRRVASIHCATTISNY